MSIKVGKKFWAIRLSARYNDKLGFVPYQEMYYDKRSEMRTAWKDLNPVVKGVSSEYFLAQRFRVTEYDALETKVYDEAR